MSQERLSAYTDFLRGKVQTAVQKVTRATERRCKVDYRLIQGDCLTVLRTLPSNSVQCCVTSPP